MRLPLRGVRIMELIGRGAGPVGDDGGETVISLPLNSHAGWDKEKGEREIRGYQVELWRIIEEVVTESSGIKRIRN